MKNKNTLAVALLAGVLLAACTPTFKTGFRHYQEHRYPEAAAVLERYRHHPKLAAAAQFYLAKIQLSATRELPGLLAIDRSLDHTDSLYRHLPPRHIRRQTRRYQLDTAALLRLREETQRWAIAHTRVRNTLPALDSLLAGLSHPLPVLAPDVDAAHRDIVNAHLETPDYDTMTAILRRHIDFVLPENYEHTRRMSDQLWSAFTAKYTPCEIDRFAWEHPLSFAGRDCWLAELRPLLCSGSLAELLDFHAGNRWTALEIVLLHRIGELATDTFAVQHLSPEQARHLAALQARDALRNRLAAAPNPADSAAVAARALDYISNFAPRYSAFRLMEECLQYFLNGRHYPTAIDLLERARPFFPDTLPPGCFTNFDYQRRVKPWIDGKLPILRQPETPAGWQRLDALNYPGSWAEYPVVRADGREIFFSAKNRPGNLAGADVFVAYWDSSAQHWSAPALVPELSGLGRQLPLSITADGRQLLLWSNDRLQISRRADANSAWSKPEPFPVEGIPVIGKGFLSADGTILVLEGAYSSGSATQAPDLDLFVSIFDPATGAWSRPAALGADINTDGHEGAPWLSADGRTLYYTSTGYPGLGASDIFQTRRTRDDWTHWTRPANLGTELNNTYPHPGFTSVSPDGGRAWLSVAGALWEVRF
ncbi:MAG: PD40 domain-containing protein [Saprospiraceae bacterium]|nr:PD40 domain-containing protein [Saprospiraceae bacterium]